ncbi:MAG: hypothetical protein BM555_02990 [Crocinitomix sp. MedPE-SWsnd]|jgi:Secretion system C-terminal sorting domain|nr:MAG: hypothetical protein BM555_02990 [Crocinitomix sp. MedPE-SWsnd]
MKINLLLAASMAFSFNAISQVEIEPFAPTVPGTYIGDFNGTLSSAIPGTNGWTSEGPAVGTYLFVVDDGLTLYGYDAGAVGTFCSVGVDVGSTFTMISPEMDFGTNTLNPTMDFRWGQSQMYADLIADGYCIQNFEIMYKESSGGAWTVVQTISTLDAVNMWTDQSIDLSGASSYSTFYIGIRVNCTTAGSLTGLGVTYGQTVFDEIVITGEPNTCTNTTSSPVVNTCDSYTVPSGDETYMMSGIYMDTIPNAGGCDSIMTIDVTLGNNTSAFTVNVCDDYTVPSGDETYSVNGTVMDTITNTAGCDSVMTITVNVVEPDVTISNTAGTLMADAAGLAYQWIDCSDNSPVSGETGQSFTPTANGDYAVIVTELGCSDTSDCENISGLGIGQNDLSFNIYPNPATDVLTIETSLTNDVQLQLLSIDGKQLRTVAVLNPSKYVLDVSTLPNGVYILKLNDSDGNMIQKTLFKQ